tara:strand:+ start:3259 stop:3462 length:204 start_codon:yes stop_codon:yes gene_type:complete
MANCKYCGKEISWLKDGRKYLPLESDGSTHECENYKNSRSSAKKVSISDISPEEIAKYEQNINKKKK